ncbi:MAG: M20/M25/M40 family metallo-hydrolase [Saprospiraceae bacterium]|nr:M20/M25/M40 family metallo-hydrolase [Saprospiraceae bacterium]
MKLRSYFCLGCFLVLSSAFKAQSPSDIRIAADETLHESIEQLRALLSLSNDAHYPDDLQLNISWLINAFSNLGFSTQRLPTDGIDILLAEKSFAGADKTVLVYLQIDGQPVDPGRWLQPNPFIPVLKEKVNMDWKILPWETLEDKTIDPDWRIFCRSASDAKGPVSAFITALRIMQAKGWQPNFNLKVIMDCEEELGSPHLPDAVKQYRKQLEADMLVIFDGPRHISNRPTLTFGARGITTMRLTTYGPRVPQHSGHYGNYAPNPALKLAQLLASMKDDRGRVTIPGFYDGIHLDSMTRVVLAAVPDDEAVIRENLGIAEPDGVADTYQESIQYPSLNIQGMSSAWVGTKVRTIVPAAAVANIDIRTVKESDPQRLVELVIQHIISQGYHICAGEPTEEERKNYPKLISLSYEISYEAFRTDFTEDVSLWCDRALTRFFGVTPIKIRTSGGSIPIAPFVQTLGLPAVTVPIVNRDNNQHSPNENIRIGNYLEGIYTYLALLTQSIE